MAQNILSTGAPFLGDLGNITIRCSQPLDIFTMAVNGISFLINCFHLFIIVRLETLKGTKYRCVLINIALSDMVNTIVTATLFTCYDYFAFIFGYGEPKLRIPVMICVILSNYISFQVFVVASTEKFLVICRPFTYQSSALVRRLSLNFVIVRLYMFSLCTIVTLIETLNVIAWRRTPVMAVLQTVVFAIVPNLLSSTLLIKVYRELRRMMSQSQNSAVNEKTRAAMYLIIIFTLEMIAFLLNSVCAIFVKCTAELIVCKVWYAFIKAPYTMLKTFIYGWRTESYRKNIRTLLSCNRHQSKTAEG